MEGEMESGCEDLLFMTEDNVTVPYFLESGCNTNYTRVWLTVYNPPGGVYTLYMQFGDIHWEEGPNRNRSKFDGRLIFPSIELTCPEGYTEYDTGIVDRHIRVSDTLYSVGADGQYGGDPTYDHHHHWYAELLDEPVAGVHYSHTDVELDQVPLTTHIHLIEGMSESTYNYNELPQFDLQLCSKTPEMGPFMSSPGLVMMTTESDYHVGYDTDLRFMEEMNGLFPYHTGDSIGHEEGQGSFNHSHEISGDWGPLETLPVPPTEFYIVTPLITIVNCGGCDEEVQVPKSGHRHYFASGEFTTESHMPPYRSILFYELVTSELESTGPPPGTVALSHHKGVPMGWEDITSLYDERYLRAGTTSDDIDGSEMTIHGFEDGYFYSGLPEYDTESSEETMHHGEGNIHASTDHRHKVGIQEWDMEYENENYQPFNNFALWRRKEGNLYNYYFGEISELNWFCFGIQWEQDRVCDYHGFCFDDEVCICDEGYHGQECRERIDGGFYNEENEIYINWEAYVSDVELFDERMKEKFECNILIVSDDTFRTKIGEQAECTWKNEQLTRTSYMVIYLSEKYDEDSPIRQVVVTPVTYNHEKTVVVDIEPLEKEGRDSFLWLIGASLSTLICILCFQLGILVLFCCIFVYLFFFFILAFGPCICFIYLKQRRGLEKLAKIDDIDLLLMEQSTKDDFSVARLTIKKDLFEVKYEDIKIIDRITNEGSGTSTIYRCEWNHRTVAFKCFKTRDICTDQSRFEEFEREVQILSSLSHPSILRFFGAVLKEPRVGILMEYCDHGDVQAFLEAFPEKFNGAQLDDLEKIRILKEIVGGMAYIHCSDVIHRDLKPKNVLLTNLLEARIMDFGLSKMIEKIQQEKTRSIGTSFFKAPEITRGEDYSNKCDVYSFGITMYEIIHNNFEPYGKNFDVSIEFKIAQDPLFRPMTSASVSRNVEVSWLVPIWQKCWSHEPVDRPSFEDLQKLLNREEEVGDVENKNRAGRSCSFVRPSTMKLMDKDRKVLVEEEIEEYTSQNQKLQDEVREGQVRLDIWKDRVKSLQQELKRIKSGGTTNYQSFGRRTSGGPPKNFERAPSGRIAPVVPQRQ